MILIEIEKGLNEQIQTFFGKDGKKINNLLSKALRKTTSYINKSIKKEIGEEYEIFPGLVNASMKSLTKKGESVLMASLKRNDISNFYVSNMTPGKNKSNLLVRVKKKNGDIEMKTMFWGYYKKDTSKIGLFIRNGERNHITRVKTVSSFQMASNSISDDVINNANNVFNKALENEFNKELKNV